MFYRQFYFCFAILQLFWNRQVLYLVLYWTVLINYSNFSICFQMGKKKGLRFADQTIIQLMFQVKHMNIHNNKKYMVYHDSFFLYLCQLNIAVYYLVRYEEHYRYYLAINLHLVVKTVPAGITSYAGDVEEYNIYYIRWQGCF